MKKKDEIVVARTEIGRFSTTRTHTPSAVISTHDLQLHIYMLYRSSRK